METHSKQKSGSVIPSAIAVSILIVGFTIAYKIAEIPESPRVATEKPITVRGTIRHELPVMWGDLGARLLSTGVLDEEKIKELYADNPEELSELRKLLYSGKDQKLLITEQNAHIVLNLLWALGLAQRSPVLDRGEISEKRYGGIESFASTGGWTLARGNLVDHIGKHKMFELTPEQEGMVDRMSKNIYRPCCDNSTHFPDCNHGMAMLGFLELMAAQGMQEDEMYKTAYVLNSYWFPSHYDVIKSFMSMNGTPHDARVALGKEYSSASGFKKVNELLQDRPKERPRSGGGGSCSV